jgi:hypothetical protein
LISPDLSRLVRAEHNVIAIAESSTNAAAANPNQHIG